MKKYVVRLSTQEREELSALIDRGNCAAYKRKHAAILLKADVGDGGAGWTDQKISQAFDVTTRTVEHVRQRLVEEGMEAALNRRKQERPSREIVLDGEKEAKLVALCCSPAPSGVARWTLRLLADKLVQLDLVERVSHETVRKCLKKRTEALEEKDVVYPTRRECRVRGRHGERTGHVSAAL